MRKDYFQRAASLVATTLLLAGCASSTPQWDRSFGHAVRANLAAQTIDPQAGRAAGVAEGMDGKAALNAQKSYARSFGSGEPAAPTLMQGSGK